MDADDGAAPVADDTHSAWTALDDALQILVRAESLVLLLEHAFDVEEHHRYGAQIACDHLHRLKQRIHDAQALIRPRRSEPLGASSQALVSGPTCEHPAGS